MKYEEMDNKSLFELFRNSITKGAPQELILVLVNEIEKRLSQFDHRDAEGSYSMD